uniref:glycosyltransferase family 2 protein n=1 Tax=Flavobacterium sp. TaxID=239 RepID=UPI00404A8C9C
MKVTVLIINYKNWLDTIECLESVLKSNYKFIEVLVVDNSPNEESIKNLVKWAEGRLKINDTKFPELIFPLQKKPIQYATIKEDSYLTYHSNVIITFIKANKNNGFAAANNVVLKKIIEEDKDNGEFVFLLNNDTVIQKNTISNLIENYTSDKIGIAGCTLLEYYDPHKVQSVGGKYKKFFGITKQVCEGQLFDEFIRDKVKKKIDYPAGAAMFLSIEHLKEIGELNEEYFLYFEELDWVRKSSVKKTTYYKDCIVYHKGGVSIGSNKKSYIADKYSILNRINFAKNYNRANLFTVYIGVFLAIFKRITLLKLKTSIWLIRDLYKNEN